MVRQSFYKEDVEEILSIPIRADTIDWVAWHYDTKGCFSVKSTYRVQLAANEIQGRTNIGMSSEGTSSLKDVWKGLWNLHCPARVHHFLWRLSHNSHPLHMNIARKGVDLDTRCVVCHSLFEDGGHLFFRCRHVKPI